MVPRIFLKVVDLGPLPQTPRFIAWSQSRGRSQPSRATTKRSASKTGTPPRSWALDRRSGRFSAWPYYAALEIMPSSLGIES